MAFNAKNLTYERNEPAFLQKLRGQYGGGDSIRHERPAPRPRKEKENDDEDAPVYVDEETNEAISKEDYESLLKGLDASGEAADQNAEESKEPTDPTKPPEQASNEDAKAQQNLAEIGGGSQKKRRKAKVIRDDEVVDDESRRKESPAVPKSNAKRKKIKLSFDEPE